MKVSVIIATYGDEAWRQLADDRAAPSAVCQDAHEVLQDHFVEGTVASSRNGLAEQASGDWLCFLDADDELAPGYLGAMRRALEREKGADGAADLLLTPAVSYVRGRRHATPMFHPPAPLHMHNWLVIGTLIPRRLFHEVGGFRDYGDPPGSVIYEDWGLWGLCEKAGARIVRVKQAVYRAYWSEGSRNHQGSSMLSAFSMWTVGRDVWPEHYPATFEQWQRGINRQHARQEQRLARRRR